VSGLQRELEHEPQPLLFGPGRLGIIWSPKAACTTVLLWYLWRCGLLQEALAFDPWPHRYRRAVLYKSDGYRECLAEASATGWSWLRVVRDPYARAVSSYRHALRWGYEDARMTRFLRRPTTSEAGFSFEQFLDYLLLIDIATCNLHHQQQLHPIEAKVTLAQVINVDRQDLMASLTRIGETLPLPAQPLSALEAAIARIAAPHHARQVAFDRDQAATVFTKAHAAGDWPSYGHFLNASTRGKIARIYAADFARYADHL
jgi:hypothetical protein